MSQYLHAVNSAQSSRPTAARPFLMVPIDLVMEYKHRPSVIGIYACIARLNAIYKTPVAISRTDLANWCGIEPDRIAGAIKRAIDDMAAEGWLMKARDGQGKLELLASWGNGAHGQPRPLQFSRPDRGRPRGMRYIEMPVDVIDWFLGRLIPALDEPATIERYFSRPLLSFADLGICAVREVAVIPVTSQLTYLGLDDTLPNLADLLTRVASGKLVVDDETVRLTPAGAALLQRRSFFAPGRSPGDLPGRSPGGSEYAETNPALESVGCDFTHSDFAAWDRHGINKQILDPSSKDLQEMTNFFSLHNEIKNEIVSRRSSQTTPGNTNGDSDFIHNSLRTMLSEWHRALNPDRAIEHAELFALLDLQQRYGEAALRRWMFRASNSRKTIVLPAYYERCAADDALTALRPARVTQQALVVQDEPTPVPVIPVTVVDEIPPMPRASAEQLQLITAIGERFGHTIRRPELLATAPIALLQQWEAIAEHPGLKKWTVGWVVTEIARGHQPPKLEELNRWAEEKGIHWADPRLAQYHSAQVDFEPGEKSATEFVEDISEPGEKSVTEFVEDFEAAMPSMQPDPAMVWQDVIADLHMPALRLLLSNATFSMQGSSATITLSKAAHGKVVEPHFFRIRALLREYLGDHIELRLRCNP